MKKPFKAVLSFIKKDSSENGPAELPHEQHAAPLASPSAASSSSGAAFQESPFKRLLGAYKSGKIGSDGGSPHSSLTSATPESPFSTLEGARPASWRMVVGAGRWDGGGSRAVARVFGRQDLRRSVCRTARKASKIMTLQLHEAHIGLAPAYVSSLRGR